MDKSYRPKDIEQRQYERWESNGWFAPSGEGEAAPETTAPEGDSPAAKAAEGEESPVAEPKEEVKQSVEDAIDDLDL